MTANVQRLSFLLKAFRKDMGGGLKMRCTHAEEIAEHLDRLGAIVPPCKVGDIIYAPIYDEDGGEAFVDEYEATGIAYIGGRWCVQIYDGSFIPIGEDGFLTEQGAKDKLIELVAR